MTGEITLSGRILAVGGVREKILAARREGIDTVILPLTNEKEVEDLPKYLRDEFTFIYAKQIDEVMMHFFSDEKQKQPRKSKAKIVRGKNVGKPRPKLQPPASPPG